VEFASLAYTFEELERTSSRLALIGLLTQLFRSIESPDELEQVCYLVQGRVAPFFEALEMGMAEKTVARSIAMAYNATLEHIAALYAELGDMGLVAGKVNSEAGHIPHVLSVDKVFLGLRAIAQTAGKGAVEQKIARLTDLLTRVDSVSAKYGVLGHIQCACLLKRYCDLMVRHWRTFCSRIPAVKPMSVPWRHSPSIFLLFLDSHQQWIWIVSRCTSRQFTSIFMQHLSLLDAHDVEQRGHESTVAISAPLLISRLVGEVSRSNYWCASGSVQRLCVPNTSLLNASQRWSSVTPG